MKLQATTKQIQNSKCFNFIILTSFKTMEYIRNIQPETCFEKL